MPGKRAEKFWQQEENVLERAQQCRWKAAIKERAFICTGSLIKRPSREMWPEGFGARAK